MAHESLPPGHQGSPTFKLLCNKTPIWRLNSKRCLLLTVRKWKPYFADMDKASSSILKSIILKFQVPVDCHNRNHLYPICGGSAVKKKKQKQNCLPTQETWVQPLGQEDPLEKKMATHSHILAWRIPWTEEPGGNSLWDQKRVRHNLMAKR